MNTVTDVPPGFRFHPTDEELIDYYLRKKIASKRIDLDVIKDVDLYKIEPWDLQELCKMGGEDQNDWYFFSHKDKKYPRSSRSNRATKEGFWKATGRDKAIYSRNNELIGMRKTLVFYQGRAPNGLKSDWIMHEYRLQSTHYGTPQEEGWVVCRVFKKRITTPHQKVACDYESPNYNWYDDQPSFFMQPHVIDSPTKRLSISDPSSSSHYHHPQIGCPDCASPSSRFNHRDKTDKQSMCVGKNDGGVEENQVMDWRAMDKYVASQLSIGQTNEANGFHTVPEDNNYASE